MLRDKKEEQIKRYEDKVLLMLQSLKDAKKGKYVKIEKYESLKRFNKYFEFVAKCYEKNTANGEKFNRKLGKINQGIKGIYKKIKKLNGYRLYSTEQKKKRMERLVKNGLTTVYHETCHFAAESILTQKEWKKGSGGIVGGAIYFAKNQKDTRRKAHSHGVIFEIQVYLGDKYNVDHSDKNIDIYKLIKEQKDSIEVARAGGTEYVIYNPDQIYKVKVVKVYHSLDKRFRSRKGEKKVKDCDCKSCKSIEYENIKKNYDHDNEKGDWIEFNSKIVIKK